MNDKLKEAAGELLSTARNMAANHCVVMEISPTCELLKFTVYRAGRTDDEIDQYMRMCKVSLCMSMQKCVGYYKDVRLRYRVVETKDEYHKAVQKSNAYLESTAAMLGM